MSWRALSTRKGPEHRGGEWENSRPIHPRHPLDADDDREQPDDHPSSIIYFWVEDIQGAYDVLSARGVRFEANPHLAARRDNYDVWMAFLRDVDNNLLALMSELQRT